MIKSFVGFVAILLLLTSCRTAQYNLSQSDNDEAMQEDLVMLEERLLHVIFKEHQYKYKEMHTEQRIEFLEKWFEVLKNEEYSTKLNTVQGFLVSSGFSRSKINEQLEPLFERFLLDLGVMVRNQNKEKSVFYRQKGIDSLIASLSVSYPPVVKKSLGQRLELLQKTFPEMNTKFPKDGSLLEKVAFQEQFFGLESTNSFLLDRLLAMETKTNEILKAKAAGSFSGWKKLVLREIIVLEESSDLQFKQNGEIEDK